MLVRQAFTNEAIAPALPLSILKVTQTFLLLICKVSGMKAAECIHITNTSSVAVFWIQASFNQSVQCLNELAHLPW